MLLGDTLVEKARAEEMSVIREQGVREVVDRRHDEVVFGTRWVDINKGDDNKPFYRSRLVRATKQTSCRLVIVHSHFHRSRLCEVC